MFYQRFQVIVPMIWCHLLPMIRITTIHLPTVSVTTITNVYLPTVLYQWFPTNQCVCNNDFLVNDYFGCSTNVFLSMIILSFQPMVFISTKFLTMILYQRFYTNDIYQRSSPMVSYQWFVPMICTNDLYQRFLPTIFRRKWTFEHLWGF